VSNDFGIGLVGTSQDNLIEDNRIGGNMNGIFIGSATKGGNVIRRNIIAGNPSAQDSATFGDNVGADIQNLAAPGANTFEENLCVTYAGAGPAPCPNFPEQHKHRRGADSTANRLTTPAQRTDVERYLPVRSQTVLINAAFHARPRRLPNASGSAQSDQRGDSKTVTVTGKVVDAACYMLHPSAATIASHKDCGSACLARGVPLAIAADDGALYFPADGNQRLKTLLNARVRASGTILEKHDPMELKMPVGDKKSNGRARGGWLQADYDPNACQNPGRKAVTCLMVGQVPCARATTYLARISVEFQRGDSRRGYSIDKSPIGP
jgi:parallel beta-helix repeat protein